MTECESRSAVSWKGWKCQLVRGHPGPHQNDAFDSMTAWEDQELPQSPPPAEIAREIVDPFHHGNLSSTGDRVVREITAAIPLQSERDGQAKRILAAVEVAKEASDEWEAVLQERITELKRQLAADDLAFEHANTVIKKYMDDLSPSPCGVKGHCKVDWTERRAGERRGNAVPGIEDRRKYGSGGSWLERRITNLGGYCVRCMEIEKAALERARDAASATVTEFVQAVKTIAPLPANTWTQTWPPEIPLARLVEYVRTEALEECCMALCTHCHCLCCGPEPSNAEVKPAVLIEGEWWHPVIWLPSRDANRVRCGAAAIRGSVQSLRKWYAS